MRDKDHFKRQWCVNCRKELDWVSKRIILWCKDCKLICKNCSVILKNSSARRNLCVPCENKGIKLYKLFPHVEKLQKFPYKKKHK